MGDFNATIESGNSQREKEGGKNVRYFNEYRDLLVDVCAFNELSSGYMIFFCLDLTRTSNGEPN